MSIPFLIFGLHQNPSRMLKNAFLRTLPAGQKFYMDMVLYKVIEPGTDIVVCRDSVFNLAWDIKGSAIVRAVARV